MDKVFAWLKSRTAAQFVFAVILLLGTFARVYMFGSVPGDINQDEAFAGYNAYTLLHHAADSYGYRLPVYLTAWGRLRRFISWYADFQVNALPWVQHFCLRFLRGT